MSVVTIRGQLGSGAPEIGRMVADRLHFDYIDREIIADIAKRLQCSNEGVELKETPAGTLLGRVVEALGTIGLGVGLSGNGIGYTPTCELPLDDAHYLSGLKSVIEQIAKNQSVVIGGRGSQFILKHSPGAIHVLVVAALDTRIDRVMENLTTNAECARREISRFDGSRREFTRRYFQADWDNPIYYDLVINTNHLTYQDASALVVDACRKTELAYAATC